ncbi:DUF421 domain-containing protein [Tepidibacter hydrothermalis]|uniref:DUF421 domain-containing protein n=1 Tax=Tepidibacter hydrothermalis TaxID=3036126 RepID=A0ABY8E7M9_9FIRM|nr:YetF domain-containing protein [Tepidibacter hydrothermalis]WFD08851.1 DUF421 domain-containing protein [Tepidibacter hydrothermalis]
MMNVLAYIIKSFMLILTTWLICNFIGKKSLAQFTPYDIAILFIISNVIAEPLVNKDLYKTTMCVILLSAIIIAISKLSLHRKFYGIDGMPSVVISDGKIIKNELKKNNISLYILLSMLRVQGYDKIADINYAILEPGGQISVMPKSKARPPTTEEMNLGVSDKKLSFAVVVDGRINENILTYANITREWLLKELEKQFNSNPGDIFYAEIDSDKSLYVDFYE